MRFCGRSAFARYIADHSFLYEDDVKKFSVFPRFCKSELRVDSGRFRRVFGKEAARSVVRDPGSSIFHRGSMIHPPKNNCQTIAKQLPNNCQTIAVMASSKEDDVKKFSVSTRFCIYAFCVESGRFRRVLARRPRPKVVQGCPRLIDDP